MNFDQFSAMPDSALKDVTDKSINPDGSKKSENSGTSEGSNSSQGSDDIFSTGSHTENKGSSNASQGQGPTPNAPNTNQTSAGKLLGDKGAKFAIDMMNLAIPALLYFVITKIGYEADKDHWKLDKDERETITPAVQAVLDKIMIDLNNPYMQLAVVLSIVYGAKTAVYMAEAKKKQAPAPVYKMPGFVPSSGPSATAQKRTFEEIYQDELKDYINEYKTEKSMGFDKAEGIVMRNKNRLKIIEKKAREKFEAQ